MQRGSTDRSEKSGSAHQSVTQWLERVKAGDDAAAQKLWDRYVAKLIRLSASKLLSTSGMEDEEDAVVAAFTDFLNGVNDRRFSELNDRHDLWQILVMLTDRRTIDQQRRQLTRQSKVLDESPLGGSPGSKTSALNQVPCPGPTPQEAALAADQLRRLFRDLEQEQAAAETVHKQNVAEQKKQIALKKLQGNSNEEIAGSLGIDATTVGRRLDAIRELMEGAIDE